MSFQVRDNVLWTRKLAFKLVRVHTLFRLQFILTPYKGGQRLGSASYLHLIFVTVFQDGSPSTQPDDFWFHPRKEVLEQKDASDFPARGNTPS